MPWTVADVDEHKKGLSDKAKQVWVKTANKTLAQCRGNGGGDEKCEAQAIKAANAVAGNMKETEMEATEVMTINVDGERVALSSLIDAYKQLQEVIKKEGAEIILYDSAGEKVLGRFPFGAGKKYASEEAAREAAKKRERQIQFFKHQGEAEVEDAVWITVEDMEEICSDCAETMRKAGIDRVNVNKAMESDVAEAMPTTLLRGMCSWLGIPGPGGFRRCMRTSFGDFSPTDKERWCGWLKARCKEIGGGMSIADETPDIAEVEAPTREQVASVLVYLWNQYKSEQQQGGEEGGKEEEETEEGMAELAESASGAAIALVEAESAAAGANPLRLDIALIKPGIGNKRDSHYYSPEMLERDAHVFKGAKMYTTDHRPEEKNVRTEVSEVLDCPIGFTDDGAPIARVGVYDPTFAESVRNRAALGTLHNLQCSILAKGKTKKGKIDGKKVNIVEAITEAISVDWVTRAGAGGHALNLAESNDGGEQMSDEVQEGAQPEEERVEEAQEERVEEALLSETEVAEILGGSNLPEAAQKRLAEAQYADAEALQEAVKAEVDYVKTITGSGKPFGQGGGAPPEQERMSEAEYAEAYNDILQRHGVTNLMEVQEA